MTSDDSPLQRGFAYGDAEHRAAYGDPEYGAAYSGQRRQIYRAVLTTKDGRRTDVTAVTDTEINYEHTAISDASLTVPRIAGLADFKFGSFDVYRGDQILFSGTLEEWPSYGTDAEATIAGRGPARELARSNLTISFADIAAWRAIKQVWDSHTSFDAIVTPPSTETTLTEFESTGSVLEILQTLHERAGMRFTVQHTTPGRVVESYDPTELVRTADWTAVEHDSSGEVYDYANLVRVYGGKASDGTRVSATARADSEIDAVGEQPWRIDDKSITTNADAQARAESELESRLENDALSGQLDVVAEPVLPGYFRTIPEWGNRTLSHDRTSFSESKGEAIATIEVNAPLGPIDELAQIKRQLHDLQQPTDVASGSGDTSEPTGPFRIDSFESGDLSSYSVINGGFEVVTGDSANAFDGTAYLEQGPDEAQSYVASAPGDGLEYYFPTGVEARVVVWSTDLDTDKRRILFGIPDPASVADCYVAELFNASGTRQLRLRKRSGGSESQLTKVDIGTSDLADEVHHEFRIKRDNGNAFGGSDGDISIDFVKDPGGAENTLASLGPYNDPDYTDHEGIGLWNNNADAETTRYDFFRRPNA